MPTIRARGLCMAVIASLNGLRRDQDEPNSMPHRALSQMEYDQTLKWPRPSTRDHTACQATRLVVAARV